MWIQQKSQDHTQLLISQLGQGTQAHRSLNICKLMAVCLGLLSHCACDVSCCKNANRLRGHRVLKHVLEHKLWLRSGMQNPSFLSQFSERNRAPRFSGQVQRGPINSHKSCKLHLTKLHRLHFVSTVTYQWMTCLPSDACPHSG